MNDIIKTPLQNKRSEDLDSVVQKLVNSGADGEQLKAFARFIDQLQRWHNITFDKQTLKEFTIVSRQFTKSDFDYCQEKIMKDLSNKFKITAADVYRLCLESKIEREKRARLESSIEQPLPVNKAGRERVKRAVSDLKTALMDKAKSSPDAASKIILYEYLNHLSGDLEKVVSPGVHNENDFKEQCYAKFYKKPITIKTIYKKKVNVTQKNEKGEVYGVYSTSTECKENEYGATAHTIGYFG